MSLRNLEFAGLKDINIICKDFQCLGSAEFDDIKINGDIDFPNPLIITDNVEMRSDVLVGSTGQGNNFIINTEDIQIPNATIISVKDNEPNALEIISTGGTLIRFDTVTGSELVELVPNVEMKEDVLIGQTGNSNVLTINSENIQMPNNNIIEIKDNDLLALKIRSSGGDLIDFDTSTGAQKIEIKQNMDVAGVSDLQGAVIIGRTGQGDICTFRAENIQMPNNNIITIKDNDANALEIKSSGLDSIRFDTTTGSELVEITPLVEVLKGLNVFGANLAVAVADVVLDTGNVDIMTGECLVGKSVLPKSLSMILLEDSSHVWTNAQAPGANILSLAPGSINGDLHSNYLIEYKYQCAATNASFFLKLNFNADATADYSFRREINGAGAMANNQNQTIFVDFNSAVTETGNGDLNLYVARDINNIISGHADASSKQVGLANNPSTLQTAIYYENTLNANITSIEIDVFDANHAGCTLFYRLYRMK